MLALTRNGKEKVKNHHQGAPCRVLAPRYTYGKNKTGKTIAAIELQDWTHKLIDRIKNDEFKRKTLKNANIPLIEFHAKNLPNIEEIKTAIKPLTNLWIFACPKQTQHLLE